jgi:penicillin amidase
LRRLRRILLVLLALLVVLSLVAVGFVRRPWPQVGGNLTVRGLTAPVEVVRDRFGVPNLYAKNEHDLFFAQGYVQAQDRLWQMEMNRRVGNGELSAFLGDGTMGIDVFMRNLGLYRAAEQDWARLGPEPRAVLEAYAAGVNAFIARGRLPVEFSLLRVTPRPWRPTDTLVWGKVMSWNLGENWTFELIRARMIAKLGEALTQELLPPYRSGAPVIVPPGVDHFAWMRDAPLDGLTEIAAFFGDRGPDWGSNNWVVHGSRTATGRAMLANDTHLSLSVPSIWYENGLHGGRFDVVGFSLPGVPMVMLGHNARVAWGVSDLIPDVQDFYVEKLDDPKNPRRYLHGGQWHDLQVVPETIAIRGGDPYRFDVRITDHGPLLNPALEHHHREERPLAFRWTALDPGSLLQGVFDLNLSHDWTSFRNALRSWSEPNLNFVYADVDGNIGYQASGQIPIRAPGHQGLVPVPGWSGEFDWRGFIPFDQMPTAFNPKSGFIVTANNKVVADSYPYHLAYEWGDPYRATLLSARLAGNGKVSMADMERMQAETQSLPAKALLPYLQAVEPAGEAERRAIDVLRRWNQRNDADEPGASLFQVWYRFLLRETVGDELGPEMMAEYLRSDWVHGPMMVALMERPDDPLFDDRRTKAVVEHRDDIVRRSFRLAVAWLGENFGHDPAGWPWGRLHTVTLAHRPIGESGIPVLSALFNVGPLPAAGDRYSVNSAWFSLEDPMQPYAMNGGAAHRFLVDLGDLDGALGVINSGESEHLFGSHRDDLVPLWQRVAYQHIRWSRGAVRKAAAATLILRPEALKDGQK